jgi:hypothetical protein
VTPPPPLHTYISLSRVIPAQPIVQTEAEYIRSFSGTAVSRYQLQHLQSRANLHWPGSAAFIGAVCTWGRPNDQSMRHGFDALPSHEVGVACALQPCAETSCPLLLLQARAGKALQGQMAG